MQRQRNERMPQDGDLVLTCMKRLIGVTYICTKYSEAPKPATPAATTAFCQTSGTELEDVRQIPVSTSKAAKQQGTAGQHVVLLTKLHACVPEGLTEGRNIQTSSVSNDLTHIFLFH